MLVLQDIRVDAAEQRGKTTIERSRVHIAAPLRTGKARFHSSFVQIFGNRNKHLLDRLVRQ